ncbi:MAG: c-type cytochrome [Verrucomicrobia bacterium]|nr:c-type cytochrome [Verrucomicrobiota bacterium]
MIFILVRILRLGLACAFACSMTVIAQDKAGPETEKRFPPLKIPAGFKATLFACDPLIEYPSAIALGPRPASIFVAIDYMTGLGTEIVRRDEIRLAEDSDGDGYADKAPVYADGFNSIQGLTFHDGTVYVMHAPFLTSLRDTDGDGRADIRRDLLQGLGLTPEENPVRLHCANGVVMGHDGWLYLALGDHGCVVTRREGDRLVLEGGGILRCRADGRDLHVFATGLRNIYDIALDDELNVFVRDNENDGGDYKIRVCQSFFGADHGYPYHYYERPDEALAPLADLGLGSSAGGLCYLENAFPSEYHNNLFFCEWGRSVVRFPLQRVQSAFATAKELEFAAAAANDPYGFKPTDLVVERDGSLVAADWADGQRPKRGRGRIYRIRHVGSAEASAKENLTQPADLNPGATDLARAVAQLDSASYYQRIDAQTAIERKGLEGLRAAQEALQGGRLNIRGRMHAVWIMARSGAADAIESLLHVAENDREPRVRAQTIRAVADLADPTLTQDRLNARSGDARLAERLAALGARAADSRTLLEATIALGRLRWTNAAEWIRTTLTNADRTILHAAMQTLRRSENWPAVLNFLDDKEHSTMRTLGLRALAERAEPAVVDGAIDRLRHEQDPIRRREYADLLARVHRKPGPWTYWGYRPAPRPANTIAWERTDAIEQSLDRLLADSDRSVRLAVLRRMQRENILAQTSTLARWLDEERDHERVGAILVAMRNSAPAEARDALMRAATGKQQALTNRLASLALFAGGLDSASEARLMDVIRALEDGPVLGEALRQTAKRPALNAVPILLAKLKSAEPIVRKAAVESLAGLKAIQASDFVRSLLEDQDVGVRTAAASAAGALQIRSAAPALIGLARDSNLELRRASLTSLRLLKDANAVPIAVNALHDRELQAVALACLFDLGGPAQLQVVLDLALRDPSVNVLTAIAKLITKWSGEQPPGQRTEIERALSELHGKTGSLLRWAVAGPLQLEAATSLVQKFALPRQRSLPSDASEPSWQTSYAEGVESRVTLSRSKNAAVENVWVGYADFYVSEPMTVQFLGSSRSEFRLWLDARPIHQREARRASAELVRFDQALTAGAHRLAILVNAATNAAEFNLRFRRKSSASDHEQLVQAALTRSGNVDRGRKLFFNIEKSQCLKCHRFGGQGEQIGPELTALGNRFSRIHIIESLLEPSRTIASSFHSVELILKDGRELSGIVMAENDRALTLADSQGKKHEIPTSALKERRNLSLSVMPEGLEKAWTTDEFVDLIAFLVSQ